MPPGHPGHGGIWPKYLPPTQGKESRSPCPGYVYLLQCSYHSFIPNAHAFSIDSTPLPTIVRLAESLPGLSFAHLYRLDILPRDGRHITYKQLSSSIQHAFNFSPTLADQLTASAKLLDQGRGWIDLHDLNALNVSSNRHA